MKLCIKLLFLFFLYGYSQDGNLIIEYSFFNNSGSQNFELNTLFLANSFSSIYVVLPQEDTVKSKYSFDETDESYKINIDISDGKKVQIFTDLKSGSLIHNSNIGSTSYVIQEKINDFNWELINETKKINNLPCYKAVSSFRGRNYIAWYCPEIPVNLGPWKFSGLPGIILDIYDDTNTFRWTAKTVEFPVKDKSIINPFKDRTPTSLYKYVKAQENYFNEKEKMRISKLPKGFNSQKISSVRMGLELIYEWEEQDVVKD